MLGYLWRPSVISYFFHSGTFVGQRKVTLYLALVLLTTSFKDPVDKNRLNEVFVEKRKRRILVSFKKNICKVQVGRSLKIKHEQKE